MSRFKEVVGHVGIYTSAFALTQFVSVIGALLIRYFLGPLQTGVWSLVQVVLSYTDYANLGATYAIPIEIPFKKAQGKLEETERMKNVMFSFSFLTSVLFSLGVMAFAFVRRRHISDELFYGLLISTGLVILQQMNNVLISLLRAYKNFKLAGKQMVLSSVINLVLVATLSFLFKLYGFMWAMCLSFVFNIAYIFFHESFGFQWTLDIKVLRGLIQYGFPLMVLTFAGTVLLTLDKMMIAKYLGLEALGLYSIAVMTSGFISSVPTSIGVVLIPSLSEKYAESERIGDLRGYLVKTNHIFSILMPMIIGLSWFLVPCVVRFFIPKFLGGIGALKYLSLSTFFIGLTQNYSSSIVVSKKHISQFPITLGVCLVAFVLIFFTIKQGGGINGVAVAMTAVMMANFTALFIFVGRHVFAGWELFREYSMILMNFIMMVFVLFILDARLGMFPIGFRTGIQVLAVMVLYVPLMFYVVKKYGIWAVFQEKLFGTRPTAD